MTTTRSLALWQQILDGLDLDVVSRADNSVHTIHGPDGATVAEIVVGDRTTRLNLREPPADGVRVDVPLSGRSQRWLGGGVVVDSGNLAGARSLLSQVATGVRPQVTDIVHLVVKWSARWEPATIDRHRDVTERHGSVWWALWSQSEESRVASRWIDQLRDQLASNTDTFVFISGPSCWRTRLLAIETEREQVDEELVPAYYGSLTGHAVLWLKLAGFEPTNRDALLRELDPANHSGKPVALGNQTNPLIVRFRTAPRVWWVNQGSSFQRARAGGYVWAPLRDKAGGTPEHWKTMRHLRVGDIVLNYANTAIRAVSRVASEATPSPRPDPDADQAWIDDGLRANIEYRDLNPTISLYDIPSDWREAERGVFGRGGNVNQGYLFNLSDDFAAKLQQRFLQLGLDDLPSVHARPNRASVTPAFDLAAVQAAATARGLRLAPDICASLIAALESGKHVILTGPPGTAKTTLAEVVAATAVDTGRCSGYTLTTATADWTTYETIGGLRPNLENGLTFQEGHFLEAIRRNHWLVIDELNRSNFDRAFGQLFTVLSGQAVELPYEREEGLGRLALVPEGARHQLRDVDVLTIPASWRVIATMNVFDKSLLFEMSFALMRRFAFIEVPSPPADQFEALVMDRAGDDLEARDLALRFLELRKLKDLGPAVFMDLANFLRMRRKIGTASQRQVAFEAFYSYLLPQFEGVDEIGGERLYRAVRRLVGSENETRLRQTLRAVLGLDLSVAERNDIVGDDDERLDERNDLDPASSADS